MVILADPERVTKSELEVLEAGAANRTFLVAGALLDELADQDSPRGLLALFPRLHQKDLTSPALPGLYLFAEKIQDPRNLGALIRVGVAFGARAFFLSAGCCSVSHPRVIRSSAGLAAQATIYERIELASAATYLSSLSPMVAALDPASNCSVSSVEFPSSVLLLVGTEGKGLSEELLRQSTLAMSIPMNSKVESLNLATAVAVACYEYSRQLGIPA